MAFRQSDKSNRFNFSQIANFFQPNVQLIEHFFSLKKWTGNMEIN